MKFTTCEANQPMKERIAAMFGKSYKASLLQFEEQTSYVTVRGILSDPKLTKKSRGEQFLFVNNRPFQHRYLTHVVLSIYDPWMGENEYPFFAIFLDIDPKQVDVNVHPAKEEVKFEDERSVIKLVKSVVKKALNEHFMVPDVDRDTPEGPPSGRRSSSGFNSDFTFKRGSGRSSGRSSDKSGPMRFPSRINYESKGSKGEGDSFASQLYQHEKGEAIPNRTRKAGRTARRRAISGSSITAISLRRRGQVCV
ncbi:MAG: hypothetical protein U5K69_24885 [Balneolaceae bacterium]|nr:hypothetical protein [Balneolaceae bacterium]